MVGLELIHHRYRFYTPSQLLSALHHSVLRHEELSTLDIDDRLHGLRGALGREGLVFELETEAFLAGEAEVWIVEIGLFRLCCRLVLREKILGVRSDQVSKKINHFSQIQTRLILVLIWILLVIGTLIIL